MIVAILTVSVITSLRATRGLTPTRSEQSGHFRHATTDEMAAIETTKGGDGADEAPPWK